MKSCLRTLGTSLANSMVIPAAWLSGLTTTALVWGVIAYWPDKLSVLGRQLFLASVSIFCLSIWHLIRRKRRAKALVASINLKDGLSLDDTQMLGFPSPLFFVFDPSSKNSLNAKAPPAIIKFEISRGSQAGTLSGNRLTTGCRAGFFE
ncbi:hypothetical protein [Pseudomonas mediterranea]|uniref:hypothetical protein n=1 Tax=Pseudomonas mediterranea TaxID=183795 RepID=UPI001E3E7FD3|nr:hypothetical protein [Pseudomonas mediterranea]MDU9030986.1 hypothetical protein [Pseudomonas mediterranea]